MSKKKIFVVDDEIDLCRHIKLNLEATGEFEVLTESNGLKAAYAAQHFLPDLIVLDIMMPYIGGEDVLLKIQEIPELANIPVIFLTAIVNPEELGRQSTITGGNFIVAKPISPEDLIKAIKSKLPA